MKTLPTIDTAHVKNWLRSAGWKQNDELANLNPAAIARACNRERQLVVEREAAEKRMALFRTKIQAARTAADTLKSELPPIIEEISNWPEGLQRAAYLVEIQALHDAVKRVHPPFTAMRRPGGQPVVWSAFALRLSDHLRLSEPSRHLRMRAAELIARAIPAVFAIAVDAESVAKQITRQRTKKHIGKGHRL
jgi:hypothetical protein